MRRAVFVFAAALAAGCGHADPSAGPVKQGPLTVSVVDYNPSKVDLGQVAAVADLGSQTVVFGDKGMSVLVAGAAEASDGSVTAWQSAGILPAADGEGEWIVGVGADGHVYAIDAEGQLGDVSDRYGLLDAKVSAVAATGGPGAAFQIDAGIAVADGVNVTRYDLPVTGIAGEGGRVAGVAGGKAHVFDAASGKDTTFPVTGAVYVAFDAYGKVVVATAHALYGEDETGNLEKRIDLPDAEVHGLASSPRGVWVALGSELGLLDGDTLGVSKGAKLPADATLVTSSSGDVWAISKGTLSRFSAAGAGDEALWDQTVAPIFSRVCAECHLPGGTANIDLSYYGAWVAKRDAIQKRVIDMTPTAMPPKTASEQLTAEDVKAIQAWLADVAKSP
jgi:mono/diheme cytochrome c family protein